MVELLSKVIEHLALGEVMQMSGVLPPEELEDKQAAAAVAKEDLLSRYINGYMNKSYFKTASLVANSCRATVLLGAHISDPLEREELMRVAHSFGRHIGYAYQVCDLFWSLVGNGRWRKSSRCAQSHSLFVCVCVLAFVFAYLGESLCCVCVCFRMCRSMCMHDEYYVYICVCSDVCVCICMRE